MTNRQKNWSALAGFVIVAGGLWMLKEHLVERGVQEQLETDRERERRIDQAADEVQSAYQDARGR